MGLFDNFNPFPKQERLGQEQLQVQALLKHCSLDDLEKIAKAFISRDPKVQYRDTDGILKTRKPNRSDLVNGITKNVSLEGVLDVCPKLKNKL